MIKSKFLSRFMTFSFDFGLRIALQAAFFVLLSRLVGPATLGAFTSLTAITTLISCLNGLGSEQLMLRSIENKSFDIRREFGVCSTATLETAPILFLVGYPIVYWICSDSISWWGIISVLISDLIFTRVSIVVVNCLFASERNVLQLLCNIVLPIARLIFVGIATIFSIEVSVDYWCLVYSGTAFLSAMFSLAVFVRVLGFPEFTRRGYSRTDGLLISLEYASMAAFRDLDKPVVDHSLGPTAAGLYAASFRIVDTAGVPVRAYLQATYLKYFRLVSNEKLGDFFRYALINLLVLFCLGGLVAVSLLFIAPYVPIILGKGYEATVSIIISISVYPILLGASGAGSDALRALGLQSVRMISLTITYVAYVPAIYYGSVGYGIYGAALARLGVQVLLCVTVWMIVLYYQLNLRTDANDKW